MGVRVDYKLLSHFHTWVVVWLYEFMHIKPYYIQIKCVTEESNTDWKGRSNEIGKQEKQTKTLWNRVIEIDKDVEDLDEDVNCSIAVKKYMYWTLGSVELK